MKSNKAGRIEGPDCVHRARKPFETLGLKGKDETEFVDSPSQHKAVCHRSVDEITPKT